MFSSYKDDQEGGAGLVRDVDLVGGIRRPGVADVLGVLDVHAVRPAEVGVVLGVLGWPYNSASRWALMPDLSGAVGASFGAM